jgi:hypothetical protein
MPINIPPAVRDLFAVPQILLSISIKTTEKALSSVYGVWMEVSTGQVLFGMMIPRETPGVTGWPLISCRTISVERFTLTREIYGGQPWIGTRKN